MVTSTNCKCKRLISSDRQGDSSLKLQLLQPVRYRGEMKGLKLLIWKNFKILSKEKLSLATSILFPLACIFSFAALRSAVKQTKHPEPTIYEAFSASEIPRLLQYVANGIYYAPSNPMTDKIMQLVLDDSFNARGLQYNFTAFDRTEELYHAYNDQAKTPEEDLHEVVLAGVIFSNVGLKKLPKNIKYTLKFPGSQRTGYDSLQDQENARPHWFTGENWPVQVFGGPRSRDSSYGGFPGYFDEGYLYLQNAINEAIIKILLNSTQVSDMEQYLLRLQRFPAPPFTDDKFSFIIQLFLGFLIAAAFTYNVMELTRQIIHEKSSRLKEFMKIMGLPSWQHWLAWFIRSYSILLIISVVMVFILKLEINDGVSVLMHSDPLVVFLALSIYVLNVIAFSFLFSTLFSNENAGSTAAAFTWLLFQYHSYHYVWKYFNLTLMEKILSCFLSTNTPTFLIADFLNYYENFGEGLHWDNLWTGLTSTDDFSVGICIAMSALNSVIYILAALYIELAFPGEYGVALPWYFPFTVWFWTGKNEERELQVGNSNRKNENSGAFEPEPLQLEAGVVIKNLTKVFGSKVAVNNLNLKMYQNQVTSLLGPNGAGKTTTMSILTGLIRPTGGTASVNSYDITTEMTGVRASLGLCPQYNILFDNLTVEEHFKFYCQLKGLNEAETLNETERGINILGLEDKRKSQAKNLSGGMKRKLCVGMALSAGSKVVLLDEPTAGMDPEARRSIWDLIQAEKRGRTIILSTHYMEEADLLGDRIVIIANGQLLCCGSSLFLKSKFGDAYNLVIVKKEGACSERIKRRISEIIPTAKVNVDVGAEISCTLPFTEINSFPRIFEDLEIHKDELGIGTYGVGSSTMEEIFIRVTNVGADNSLKEGTPAHSSLQIPASNRSSQHILSESVTQLCQSDKGKNNELKLLWQQFRALLIKKLLISIRRKSIILLQVIIPVIGLIGMYKIFNVFPGNGNQFDVVNSVEQIHEKFGKSTSFFNCLPDSKVCEAFKSSIEGWQNIAYVDETSLVTALLDLLTESRRRDEGKHIFAFEEEVNTEENGTQLTILFNNQAYHTPPVALNMLFNGLLKYYGLKNTIVSINHPFDYTSTEDLKAFNYITTSMCFGGATCIAMAFLAGSFMILSLSERVSKFKYLQIIAGVKLPLYWLADFLVNMTSIFFAYLGIIISIVIFDLEAFSSLKVKLVIFTCVLCFAWATIPACMVVSTTMKDSTLAYSRILAFNIFGSTILCAYGLFRSPELGIRDAMDTIDEIFSFLPSYGFGKSILNLGKLSQIKTSCAFLNTTRRCLLDLGDDCCSADMSYYAWDQPGTGKFIVRMIVIGTFCLLLLVVLEMGFVSKIKRIICSYRLLRRKLVINFDTMELLDTDVLAESHRIKSSALTILNITDNLIVKDMTKLYKGKFRAVNGLSFGVKKGEVFGLLGINGAGKTSTFKMLTGDASITSGDAYINYCSVKYDLRKARSHLGYCPQFDACIDELTGRETLTMFARLKGIPENEIDDLVRRTSENLMYQRFLDKQFGSLSGGNKRKLSTAVAMLGDPAIILLDEPTAGMDPVARRHVWNAIGRIRDSGASILLTSHNMEECEALCSTLAIMVKGQFKCLGSPQHLKSKLCPGYKLVVQLPFQVSCSYLDRNDMDDWEALFQRFQEFLEQRFPGCILKDSHCGFLEYVLPKESSTWADIFAAMEEAKRKFDLEGYNVGQVDLEQVFFNFASH